MKLSGGKKELKKKQTKNKTKQNKPTNSIIKREDSVLGSKEIRFGDKLVKILGED